MLFTFVFPAEAKRQLIDAEFYFLNENDEWNLRPGGHYFTRNMSSLIALAVEERYDVGSGFHVIAAQADSPCLKLKPKSASTKFNYVTVNVQTYGGDLWHTWFDRDRSVGGRVIREIVMVPFYTETSFTSTHFSHTP
ncbi:hypothetical protein EUGRSUZ_J00996 [Eucalyptus grandis]|uniref:Uncharacterized protein n=2 Tax=Eucalyptus grandis TaxID=71139 RepID=A0ACC3J3Y4_EUCGR|nr:hypothetical protein EUGRSUZ_J00996 [Eucalyptus grandis]